MSKVEEYRSILQNLQDWDEYLLDESRLPGARANLELLQAAADLGSALQFSHWLEWTPEKAPENTPQLFLAVCGTAGLGRLLAAGDLSWLKQLRDLANDPRWRVREAVCMALQHWGKADMPALLAEMETWASGSALEQRAAAATLCEPVLLENPQHARAVLVLLDNMTAAITQFKDRKSEELRVLRKGMAYCWSVAVAALPREGKMIFEPWLTSSDADIRWIMKENLKKKRLIRMDPAWVESCLKKLETKE